MDKSSYVPENLAELALKTVTSSRNPHSGCGFTILTKKIHPTFHPDSNATKRPIKNIRPIKVKPGMYPSLSLKRPINLKLK